MFGLWKTAADTTQYRFQLTDAQWRQKLGGPSYGVLRQEGTERPYTSPLNNEHRQGTFHCMGCNWPVYSSKTKFDSGTGWPSFWAPLNNSSILKKTDMSMLMARTEVHCANCGSHLGHVFNDGPPPTGLRYCMNGVAMTFQPGAA